MNWSTLIQLRATCSPALVRACCLAMMWTVLGIATPMINAEVVPAPLFADHAVLQRDKPVNIWGRAEANELITATYVSPSLTRTASANAGDDGRWRLKLEPLPASSESATLTIAGASKKITLSDILVGEVWLASGQSNMDVALFWTEKGKAEAASVNLPNIRYFKVGTVASDAPRETLSKSSWSKCVSGSAGGFTELGYHFARLIHEKLNVPVGIINSSYGGTSIDAWMDAATLAADPAGPAVMARWQEALATFPARMAAYEIAKVEYETQKQKAKEQCTDFKKQPPLPPSNGPGSQYMPSGLYNAMIHPLIPYTLRGVIWYQGENNTRRPKEYCTLFPSLIRSWRSRFEQGEIPFYWVQLPNYNAGTDVDWAGLREAQSMTLKLPNTAQVISIDIGDPGNVHPANKPEVARRLALLALARIYHVDDLIDSGPVFDHADFDTEVRLHFRDGVGGLKLKAGSSTIGGFTIAGADRVFHPAVAVLDSTNNTVTLRSPAVTRPVAARYAWTNNPRDLALVNRADLPLAPFRTDDW